MKMKSVQSLIPRLVIFLVIPFTCFSFTAKSQSPTLEFFSGRINASANGGGFYFRILNVNEEAFENYAQKAKAFPLFNNYQKGYSADYSTGSLYFSTGNPVTLANIQSLIKTLGFNSVMYDGKNISVNDIQNQRITVVERNPTSVKTRQ